MSNHDNDKLVTQLEDQASSFCQRFGFEITMQFKGTDCPPFETSDKHIHGDHYLVTVRRLQPAVGDWSGPDYITFDYWNSLSDKQKGQSPTKYNILAGMAHDAACPTDPDEVVLELGSMPPSQAIAIAHHAKQLQEFFTPIELDALSEID